MAFGLAPKAGARIMHRRCLFRRWLAAIQTLAPDVAAHRPGKIEQARTHVGRHRGEDRHQLARVEIEGARATPAAQYVAHINAVLSEIGQIGGIGQRRAQLVAALGLQRDAAQLAERGLVKPARTPFLSKPFSKF